MNEEFVRIAPKPVERPVYVGSIFSSDLNLTPEKRRPKDLRTKSKPKRSRSPTTQTAPVFVESHEKPGNFQSLVQPTINSTARISRQLQELHYTKFDPVIAIAKELEDSETVRTNFAEKVATAVNIKRDQNKYAGLISLDVVPNDVISSHTQPRATFKGRSSRTQDNEPQIMDFFSDDFEEENAKFEFGLLDEEMEVPSVTYQHAFDLYSHMTCWEHNWK